MTRFSGGFDGAAGPIRSVTACTCDLLPMIARAGELLHPGLDLTERAARLLARLDLGILGAAVDIWRHAGRDLGRADYRRLANARPSDQDRIMAPDDAELLGAVSNDRRKLAVL